MLADADAEIAKRDPTIPGMTTLLDPERFAAALREAFPAAPVVAVRPTYARYKPGTNCLVAYTADLGSQQVDVYGRTYSRPGKLRRAPERMSAPGPLGPGGAVLEDLRLAIYVHPNDRVLHALPALMCADTRATLVSQVAPLRPDLAGGQLTPLRYKPERRHVARVAGAGGEDAVVRIHEASDFPAARTAAQSFKSGHALRIAGVLGHRECDRVLVLDWLPGTPLDAVIRAHDVQPPAMEQVAAALRELHDQPAPRLPAAPAQPLPWRMQAATEGLSAIRPQLAPRAARLSQMIAAHLATAAPFAGAIHGDFSADQVILAPGAAGIIDLDAASHGDRTEDLGSFAAHTHREVVRGTVSRARAEAVVDKLLRAYAPEAGCDFLERFRLNFAAVLVCLSPSPFRYREPDWEQRSEALLARAEEVMAHA